MQRAVDLLSADEYRRPCALHSLRARGSAGSVRAGLSREGWRRGPANRDDVAESIGAAAIHRERAERCKQTG
jgi:hypothetical protein